jgi:hypothetical protein
MAVRLLPTPWWAYASMIALGARKAPSPWCPPQQRGPDRAWEHLRTASTGQREGA